MAVPQSALEFLSRQVERLRASGKRKRIVFPEGSDSRIIEAAGRLACEGLVEPILVGAKPACVSDGGKFVEPGRKYASICFERRRATRVTEVEAGKIAGRPLYFAAVMVAARDADGFGGGAAKSTAETVRAVLHGFGTPAD